MRNVAWILIAGSALGFIFAVIGSLGGMRLCGVGPEACSRASTNLALIAIALLLVSSTKATS